MAHSQYNSIYEFAHALNQSGVNYVVLRNFENIYTSQFYIDGHGDIDLLCDDSKKIVDHINAKPWNTSDKSAYGDGVHYYITIAGEKVSIDIRNINDGYYCLKWAKNILDTRTMFQEIYVPNPHNYFYSLAYHAILQKRKLTQEYAYRLKTMAQELSINIESYTEFDFIKLLDSYMSKNNYQYTYCSDICVPLRCDKVNKSLIRPNRKLKWQHNFFDTKVSVIEYLVKIKHIIFHQ